MATPKKDAEAPKEKPDALAEKESQIADLTNTLQRLQAEFENYRKRVDQEVGSRQQLARAETIKKLLPILDSFDHALKQHSSDEGLKHIYAQLLDILGQQGLKAIPAKGKFDPYQHEVLLTEKTQQPEGTILDELQKGYTYQGKVLRTSKVKVSTQ